MVRRAGPTSVGPVPFPGSLNPVRLTTLRLRPDGGDSPKEKEYPMNTALTFHEHQFNVVTISNQIYLSSKELAQALEYASAKSVTDIYNKNSDEFTDGMSQVVESTTSGNYRKKVRIFSLRGAHLIAMFARTPVAKEFRHWVLDVLDREVGAPVSAPAPSEPTYPPISSDYANRTEMIYYLDFKPVYCRVLKPDEIVMSHESMKEWLEDQGLVFFTREEIKNWTIGRILDIVKSSKKPAKK